MQNPRDQDLQERLEKLKKERSKDLPTIPDQAEIEQRLQNLGKADQPIPAEDELTKRLAVLKGYQTTADAKPSHYKPDRRTEQQQIDDLLKQMIGEVQLDNNMSAASTSTYEDSVTNNLDSSSTDKDDMFKKEINPNFLTDFKKEGADTEQAAKKALKELQQEVKQDPNLASLKLNHRKAGRTDKSSSSNETSSGDSDNEADNIVTQVVEEDRIDKSVKIAQSKPSAMPKQKGKKPAYRSGTKTVPKKPPDSDSADDNEELPYCTICVRDAVTRCLGCDGDLYCKRCFKECHKNMGIMDHASVPYKVSSHAP